MSDEHVPGENISPPLLPQETNLDYEYKDIPLNWLPRDFGPPGPEKALIDSVRMFGVRQPVALLEAAHEEADMEVIGGRRRIAAAWLAHVEWMQEYRERAAIVNEDSPYWLVPAMVGYDPVGMAALDAQLNSTVRPNPFSQLDRIAQMYTEGHDEKEIVAATQLPIGTVRRIWGVSLSLIQPLMEATKGGHIRWTVAEAAAKLKPTQQERLLPILADKGKVTGPDVSEVKRALHESFQGEAAPSILGEIPDYAAVAEAEQHKAEMLDGARRYLAQRLDDAKGTTWTTKDVETVRELLDAG